MVRGRPTGATCAILYRALGGRILHAHMIVLSRIPRIDSLGLCAERRRHFNYENSLMNGRRASQCMAGLGDQKRPRRTRMGACPTRAQFRASRILIVPHRRRGDCERRAGYRGTRGMEGRASPSRARSTSSASLAAGSPGHAPTTRTRRVGISLVKSLYLFATRV